MSEEKERGRKELLHEYYRSLQIVEVYLTLEKIRVRRELLKEH